MTLDEQRNTFRGTWEKVIERERIEIHFCNGIRHSTWLRTCISRAARSTFGMLPAAYQNLGGGTAGRATLSLRGEEERRDMG